jgi:hypothetical protein
MQNICTRVGNEVGFVFTDDSELHRVQVVGWTKSTLTVYDATSTNGLARICRSDRTDERAEYDYVYLDVRGLFSKKTVIVKEFDRHTVTKHGTFC